MVVLRQLVVKHIDRNTRSRAYEDFLTSQKDDYVCFNDWTLKVKCGRGSVGDPDRVVLWLVASQLKKQTVSHGTQFYIAWGGDTGFTCCSQQCKNLSAMT